jgi:hypothetical protein
MAVRRLHQTTQLLYLIAGLYLARLELLTLPRTTNFQERSKARRTIPASEKVTLEPYVAVCVRLHTARVLSEGNTTVATKTVKTLFTPLNTPKVDAEVSARTRQVCVPQHPNPECHALGCDLRALLVRRTEKFNKIPNKHDNKIHLILRKARHKTSTRFRVEERQHTAVVVVPTLECFESWP